MQGTMSGNFKATLVANHVRQLTADAALGAFTAGASSRSAHRLTDCITKATRDDRPICLPLLYLSMRAPHGVLLLSASE